MDLFVCPQRPDDYIVVWHLESVIGPLFELAQFNSWHPEDGLSVSPSNRLDWESVGMAGISEF